MAWMTSPIVEVGRKSKAADKKEEGWSRAPPETAVFTPDVVFTSDWCSRGVHVCVHV